MFQAFLQQESSDNQVSFRQTAINVLERGFVKSLTQPLTLT